MTDITEENSSRTVQIMDTNVHYHEAGQGDPVILLHSYGPGTNAWITWHKVLPLLAEHFHCIAMDLPNFGKTGPVFYEEPVHNYQARMVGELMTELGIDRAHLVGNSQGGQSAMSFTYHYPQRVRKLVWGAGHIGTAYGYRNEYLISNQPAEGLRLSREASENPTPENVRRYLLGHIFDPALVTDELVQYIIAQHTGNPEIVEARRRSSSPPHDHSADMASIDVPTLIIWGRNDRTCQFEIGINALNLTPTARLIVLRDTAHWVPFEQPVEYASHVLNFLQSDW